MKLEEPKITAMGNVTTAVTLWVNGAPTEGTNNYSIWVDAGTSRFGGTLDLSTDQSPLLIQNVSQATSPGTTTNGQIRLWEDSDAGGIKGRILAQINSTTYQWNADAGITFLDHVAYQAAFDNPRILGLNETVCPRCNQSINAGETVALHIDSAGYERGIKGEYS